MAKQQRAWYSGMATTEDWWAVWLGLTFFGLGLLTIFGVDLVGWIAYPKKWIMMMPEGAGGKIVSPGSAFYALGGKYSNTAYERMLYMGVAFFPLAYTSYINGAFVSKVFFLALILLLFISNIPPRNKIMRLLDRYEISMEELRERGIRL